MRLGTTSLKPQASSHKENQSDPAKNFAPDTGRIIAYRPAVGFGIRLDEGYGTSGGEVTPHYDSLLVKVTAFANDVEAAMKIVEGTARQMGVEVK